MSEERLREYTLELLVDAFSKQKARRVVTKIYSEEKRTDEKLREYALEVLTDALSKQKERQVATTLYADENRTEEKCSACEALLLTVVEGKIASGAKTPYCPYCGQKLCW